MRKRRKKRIRKIKTQNAIKRRRNTKKRKSNFSIINNQKNDLNYNKPYYGEYTELYDKMGLTINIDLDKIFEQIKNTLFLNKNKIYEYDNVKNKNNEFIIKNLLFNKNFRNNQNYIISKLKKKKVFSITYSREIYFKIIEKYFNIKLFFNLFTIILFFILTKFNLFLSFTYLFFSILINYYTSKLTLNSKFNVLSTFQTQNNFTYLKTVFSYGGLLIFTLMIFPTLIGIFLSLFPDNILIYYEKIGDFYLKNILTGLAGTFIVLIVTRFLFKINFFHIIFLPFFILLKLIINLYYFLNYNKINKVVYKLNIKKISYMFLKSYFLKKYKNGDFINEGYLIKNFNNK